MKERGKWNEVQLILSGLVSAKLYHLSDTTRGCLAVQPSGPHDYIQPTNLVHEGFYPLAPLPAEHYLPQSSVQPF